MSEQATAAVLHLSGLLRSPLTARSGETVGRVDDVIVRLRGAEYPLVTGLVAQVGGRRVYISTDQVASLSSTGAQLGSERVDLRSFERREGEVLLSADILDHRLIDVAEVELVRAWDVELEETPEGWVLARLDTRRPARFFGLIRQGDGHSGRDWKAFAPLIGHNPSALLRGKQGLLAKLHPADLADLLEEADKAEGEEILEQVSADPELEADVFEEMDPDHANKLLGTMSDEEVAGVLTHMEADDAADAISELRQSRRLKVLDLLPAGQRTKVLTLMGFNPGSAGGRMNTDVISLPTTATVRTAIAAISAAKDFEPESLVTAHVVGESGQLVGVVEVITLLQSEPEAQLVSVMDDDPVRVGPEADLEDVALLMDDYNLPTIPVVDQDGKILGVVTVDDVLEEIIPDDWRRRTPDPRAESAASETVESDTPPGGSRD
ncbi:MAG: magnesium transporter MgtE N-terminal domain-containing protein [Segniliparus sp.]|uniref:magnesium transporter MgtE N-terminal domain-containing protein n=1 Tax=Segniliparus sp. TaxID=2804064 RepID=UPI003F2BE028